MVFEEAGYSLLELVALNVFAPDEGNMHLLEAVATEAQKERWLRSLLAGDIRSCFCMTEPPPGAGSDPSMAIVMPWCPASARRCSWPRWSRPASRSSATWTPWMPAFPVDTVWSGLRACACRRLTFSANSAKVFVIPRFACLQRG